MATLPTYPRNALDNNYALLGTLGSMWADQLPDKKFINALLMGRTMQFQQAEINMAEAKNCVSRYAVPEYHNVQWQPLYFKLSEVSSMPAYGLTYGPNQALYGDAGGPTPYNRLFNYGDSLAAGNNTVLPLPTNVKRIRMLTNRVTDPSLVLLAGVDFKIDADDGIILTSIDVFNDPRVATRIIDSGTSTDTEAVLWAFSTDIDQQYLWYYIGSILGLKLDTSENAKKYLNAMWDMHTAAPFTDALTRAIYAAMDTPYALEAETVELLLAGRTRSIVTDKHVYNISDDANLLVAVGDKLKKYDRLVDTVEVIDALRIEDDLRMRRHSTSVSTAGMLPAQSWSPFREAKAGGRGYFYDYFPVRPPSTPPGMPVTIPPVYYEFAVGDQDIFNGYYRNDTVTVTKSGLSAHKYLKVAFDLMIMGNWRGNVDAITWEVTINGKSVMLTNFSNDPAAMQAYPESYGVGTNPRHTGATQSDLTKPHGWVYSYGSDNAMYHIELNTPHNEDSAVIVFKATNLPEGLFCAIDPMPIDTMRIDPIFISPGVPDPDHLYLWTDATDHPIYKGAFTQADFTAVYGYDPTQCLLDFHTIPDLWYTYGIMAYPSAFWGMKNLVLTFTNDSSTVINNYAPEQLVNPDLPGLSLGSEFLYGNYFSTLYFANKEVPLQYIGIDAEGRAEVRFDVMGYAGDVDMFWDDTHARGKTMGLTLANYLDKRANPIDEPGPEDLPTHVNPMKLVIRHILGYNLIVVKLKQGLEGSAALPASVFDYLRKTLPPHTTRLFFVEINVDDDIITSPIGEELNIAQGPLVTEHVGLTVIEPAPDVESVEGEIV